MELELIQPWAVPVVKTTLSSKVLQTMVEISDQALKEENLKIDLDILKQREVKNFFIDAVCQFVITCKCQMLPHMIEEITQEKWMVQILSMFSDVKTCFSGIKTVSHVIFFQMSDFFSKS